MGHKWAEKEAKARSTIILTVSDGIAAEVENLWSAADIYPHIRAEHKVDTQRRGDLIIRIHLLSLPEAASRETMKDHYERFTSLVAEAIAAGTRMEEGWERCESSLLSLPADMNPRKFQFELLPDPSRSWWELVQMFKSVADRRGLEADRTASIDAIISKDIGQAKTKPKTDHGQGNKKGGDRPRSKGNNNRHGRGKGNKTSSQGSRLRRVDKKALGEAGCGATQQLL